MNAEHSAAHDYLAEHAPDRPELAAAVVVAAWLAEHPGEGLEGLLWQAGVMLTRADVGGLAGAVSRLYNAIWARAGGIWRGTASFNDGPPADRPQPPFTPAPADLGPRIEAAELREREMIDAFLADFGATPDTHQLVAYPAPDDRPTPFGEGPVRRRDHVFVAVPVDSWQHLTGQYPPRDEACRLWPHRRIWRESIAGNGPPA